MNGEVAAWSPSFTSEGCDATQLPRPDPLDGLGQFGDARVQVADRDLDRRGVDRTVRQAVEQRRGEQAASRNSKGKSQRYAVCTLRRQPAAQSDQRTRMIQWTA